MSFKITQVCVAAVVNHMTMETAGNLSFEKN